MRIHLFAALLVALCAAACRDAGEEPAKISLATCAGQCGGACEPCSAGSSCTTGGACVSGVCSAGVCQAATCSDGVQNGSESGVDCGGSCAATCALTACTGTPFCLTRFRALTEGEIGQTSLTTQVPRALRERDAYYLDDPVAHLLFRFDMDGSCQVNANCGSTGLYICDTAQDGGPAPSHRCLPAPGTSVRLEFQASGGVVQTRELGSANKDTPKVEALVDLSSLPIGTHQVRAVLYNGSTSATQSTDLIKQSSTVTVDPAIAAYVTNGIPLKSITGPTQPAAFDWPVTTGVPLPQGLVKDVTRLALYKNGERVSAQITPVAWWHPDCRSEAFRSVPGCSLPSASAKWVHLDFTAHFEDGNASGYALRILPTSQSPIGPQVSVTEQGNDFVVDNGQISFRVSKTSFTGPFDVKPSGALNPAIPLGSGPQVRDGTGAAFFAAYDPNVVVTESHGPHAARIQASGSYKNASGASHGRFTTFLTTFAGHPYIFVSHRTTIDFNTTAGTFSNVAFPVPLRNGTAWTLGYDGQSTSATNANIYLLQRRSNGFVFGGARSDTGGRSDGWVQATTPAGQVAVALRDVYQRFPKELEVATTGSSPNNAEILAHMWPRHGQPDAFPVTERVQRANIWKHWFAHQGSSIQFTLPTEEATCLGLLNSCTQEVNASCTACGSTGLNPDKGWVADNELNNSLDANGQGMSIGGELVIAIGGLTAGQLASVHQREPHAVTDPTWNVSTRVEGIMSSSDQMRTYFPDAEDILENGLERYHTNIVRRNEAEYGMWIYGDAHDGWLPARETPELHRMWQASHYRNVWSYWMLYFRSGSPGLFDWARVANDHLMDTGITASDRFNSAGLFTDPAGAMRHVYSFVPWGGGNTEVFLHSVNPDALLLAHYLTGDARAWQLFKLWGTAMSRLTADVGGRGRNAVVPLGELLAEYRSTFDVEMLAHIRRFAKLLRLNDPLVAADFGNPDDPDAAPFVGVAQGLPYHRQWFSRYYELTRDPALLTFLTGFLNPDPSSTPPRAAFDNDAVNAFAYQATGNAQYLERIIPTFVDRTHAYYRSLVPGDPFDGYGPWTRNVETFWLQDAPYVMAAIAKAAGQPGSGITLPPARGIREMMPPAAATKCVGDCGVDPPPTPYLGFLPSLRVLMPARGEASYGMTFKYIGSGDPFGGSHYALRPGGSVAQSGSHPSKTLPSVPTVSTGNEQGLHVFDCWGQRCSFVSPISTLPEVYEVRSSNWGTIIPWKAETPEAGEGRNPMIGSGRQLWYVTALDATKPFDLRFRATRSTEDAHGVPSYVSVEDALGRKVVEHKIFYWGQDVAGCLEGDPSGNPYCKNASELRVHLDPSVNLPSGGKPVLPWRIYTASYVWGPWIELVDPPDPEPSGYPHQVYLGRTVADLNSALSMLPGYGPRSAFGLGLWLQADQGVTTGADARVSSWADQSLSGWNATQATGSAQPQLVFDLNEHAAVKFTTGRYLSDNAVAALFDAQRSSTIAAAVQRLGTGTYNNIVAAAGHETANLSTHSFHYTPTTAAIRRETTVLSRVDLASGVAPAAVFMRWDDEANLLRSNVDLLSGTDSDPLGSVPMNTFTLGGIRRGGVVDLTANNFLLGELAVYDNALDENQRVGLDSYFRGRYFSPVDLSGLALWLRANSGITLDGSGRVQTWADGSSSGFNAAQATATARPLFAATGLNGLPAVHFDGNRWLSADAAAALFGDPSSSTVFAVVKGIGLSAFHNTVFAASVGSLLNPLHSYSHRTTRTATRRADNGVFSRIDLTYSASEPVLVEVSWNGASHTLTHYVGAANGVDSDAMTQSFDAFTLGGVKRNNIVDLTNGSFLLAELVVYSRVLNQDERRWVRAYLETKYAIAQPPPTTAH